MFVEYIATRVARTRWLSTGVDDHRGGASALSHKSGLRWLCGTYGQYKSDNRLSVWTSVQTGGSSGGDVNVELKCETDATVGADVRQINLLSNTSAAVSLANGQIVYFTYAPNQLTRRHCWEPSDLDIDQEIAATNDSVVNRKTGELIACGDNGRLRIIRLDQLSPETRSPCLTTHNSLKSVDLMSNSEIVCGTSAGHLKLYDQRSQAVTLSMANQMSVITSVKRNPNNPHMIACGNDVGVMSIWDVRNGGQQVIQMSGHTSYITELAYKSNEPNVLLTSSLDGSLLRWNMSADTKLASVDAIVGRDAGSAITSFDVNSLDEIVFSADNEVLYLGHL
ncbi:nucleoporin Nup43-like [Oppia nitens]|uniref:nucleoporin Nup43-like n=1 Tax=Oppia nitens TaxID=1686743 RepID=UPI0023DB5941|nr:nucleoporin Nup43-like [Oppia nitens]